MLTGLYLQDLHRRSRDMKAFGDNAEVIGQSWGSDISGGVKSAYVASSSTRADDPPTFKKPPYI